MKELYSTFLAMIFLAAIVAGCLSSPPPTEKARYVDINVQQGKELIDSGNIFILDVRTQEEYNEGHIMNSTLIPVQELENRINDVPRDKKILVYCRSGNRSTTASKILDKNGFTQIYNMKGGIIEWKNAGYEIVT